ncbi:uncharacterized protein L969DRAFT_50771 [Mixia osmundae IAM 14324]|uniref:Uncharacterized protein n=1 Tax=Mixia osmundae (strain CBS 9802 / IAM 14324 / JCM 22182 / KY 12970) TaxID=764103 RepID=G7E0E2_MIXOS|nr:uncharacterized protein L969DRAFT_50771 [Mixia osmundae IAM 14324]KEI38311.1 hypothetical protein L969DRAFT_50771 [Mixia osmundae IAM 14324]GAA96302.1 hypothetical protein E5Q_02968 [Mixia osmundae IAM 14324]
MRSIIAVLPLWASVLGAAIEHKNAATLSLEVLTKHVMTWQVGWYPNPGATSPDDGALWMGDVDEGRGKAMLLESKPASGGATDSTWFIESKTIDGRPFALGLMVRDVQKRLAQENVIAIHLEGQDIDVRDTSLYVLKFNGHQILPPLGSR